MTLKQIVEALNEDGFSVMKCCRDTGLHPNTVYGIKRGKVENPNPLTVEALTKYIKKQVAS